MFNMKKIYELHSSLHCLLSVDIVQLCGSIVTLLSEDAWASLFGFVLAKLLGHLLS